MAGFTVPNLADAAFPALAGLYSTDFAILAGAYSGTGVLRGLDVTAQGSPNMTVAVAAGAALVDGAVAIVAAGNVTITTADGTNPRIDLITVNAAGTKAVVDGTAAAAPVPPALPAGRIGLAYVYVPASDGAINTNQIADKRVILMGGNLELDKVEFTVDDTTTAASKDISGGVITVPPTVGPITLVLRGHAYHSVLNKRVGMIGLETSATASGDVYAFATSEVASGIQNLKGDRVIAANSSSRTYKLQLSNPQTGGTATLSGLNVLGLGMPYSLAAYLGNPS